MIVLPQPPQSKIPSSAPKRMHACVWELRERERERERERGFLLEVSSLYSMLLSWISNHNCMWHVQSFPYAHLSKNIYVCVYSKRVFVCLFLSLFTLLLLCTYEQFRLGLGKNFLMFIYLINEPIQTQA